MAIFNVYYLKYFCDAVKFGGLSESAQNNFVTQSAISQAIRKLEKHFGVALITHHPNKLKLTHEGELLYESSKRLFICINDLSAVVKNKEGVVRGSTEFACSHSFALALLPKHMKEFQKCFPSIKISFRLAHTDAIKRWVQRGIIDFGIVLDNDDLTAFEKEEIYKGHYKLYYSSKIKDPSKLPFIMSEEQKETLELKKLYQNKYLKDLDKGLEVSSWEVIASFADQGLGIGFMPDYVAANKKGLKVLNLGLDPIPYKIYVIYSKSCPLNQASEKFIDFLKAENKRRKAEGKGERLKAEGERMKSN